MSWRVVRSSGSAFWLERESANGPGESIFFADVKDARAALHALQLATRTPTGEKKKSGEHRAIELELAAGDA